jgi:hypothetical protein
MNIDREGARAAGWTDEQIDAYALSISGNAPVAESSAPTTTRERMADVPLTPMPDYTKLGMPMADQFLDRSAENQALINTGLAGLGAEAAGKVAQGAGIGLGGYGAYKVGSAIFGPKGAPTPGPSVPSTAPTTVARPMTPPMTPATGGLDAGGQKLADFVNQRGQFASAPGTSPAPAAPAPTAPGAAPAAPSWMQKAMQMASTYGPAATRALGGTGAALYPSTLNTGEQETLNKLYPTREAEKAARIRAMSPQERKRLGVK